MDIVDRYSQEVKDTAVLDALIASATAAGLPIEWETLRQGVETNAAWIGDAYQSLMVVAANDNTAAVQSTINDGTVRQEIQAYTDAFFASATSQYNVANGTDYQVSSNVTYTPPNNPDAGHDNATINVTWQKPTTTNVPVPAVYSTVTTSVPTTTSVTQYRTVQDITYTDQRSSSTTQSVIPYMRSIYVSYKGSGFKPNATFNSYFDGIEVTSHIIPATEIIISLASSAVVFDNTTDVGSGISAVARTIANNPVNTLSTGDIILDNTSGATGVLIGYEMAPIIGSTYYLKLFVVNVIGTFSTGHTVTGSISSSVGTIYSINTPSLAIASPYGNLMGLFNITNDSVDKFTAGLKKLTFSTSTSSDLQADSWGSVNFTSSGTLNTIQPTITTIRNVSSRQEAYTTSQTTYANVSSQVLVSAATVQTISGLTTVAQLNQMPHVEPLAYSFFVHEETGVFVTGLDLFFSSKDTTLPVYVSIIDLVNGFPGPNEVDLSKTTVAAYDVQISPNIVIDANGKEVAAADTPTRINFKAPVFLKGLTDYCIFIKSDSFKYNVWTSYMKDSTINGMGMVSSQPLMGTLFKSQNATTWTEDQNQDLTFNLYRAKFNADVNPNIAFRNSPLKNKATPYGAIQTYAGATTVRTYLMNHGFSIGQPVSFANITASNVAIGATSIVSGKTYVITTVGTTTWTSIGASANTLGVKFVATAVGTGTGIASEAPYYGLTSAELTGTFTVVACDLDTFTVTVASAALFSGNIIDPSLSISKNVRVDNIQTIIQELKPIGTDIKYTYQGRSNTSPTVYSTLAPLPNNFAIDTNETILVMSPDNESTNGASFKLNASLSSTSDFLSPMIDTHRLSVVTTGNRIDNPSNAYNVSDIDFDSVASSSSLITVSSTNNSFNTANAGIQSNISTFIVGSYVSVTGCSNAANNGIHLITSIAADNSYFTVGEALVTESPSALTMLWGRRYRDEITPTNSTTLAKYVSKELTFANSSTSFKLFFIYNKPPVADIEIYYKISNASDSSIAKNLPYIKAPFDSTLVSSDTKTELNEGSIHLLGLSPFDTISVKIVYTSTNTNKIPRMRDFRIVALA